MQQWKTNPQTESATPCLQATLIKPGGLEHAARAPEFSLQQIAHLEYRQRWDAPQIGAPRVKVGG